MIPRNGRAFYESTGTIDKSEARRKLTEREGQVATGLHYGPSIERTRFEDLVAGIQHDYTINERRSVKRLEDFIKHLTEYFKYTRASAITTDRIRGYVMKWREEKASNVTINRELACLKRIFRLTRVLEEAKRRRDAKYSTCPWVCQRRGKQLERFRRTWKQACERVGLEGRIIHDFRRTAVRNMVSRVSRRSSRWRSLVTGPGACLTATTL